mgnify:FL=1
MEFKIGEDRKLVWKKREIQIHKLHTAKTSTISHKKGDRFWKSYAYCSTINGALRVLYREGLANNPAVGVDKCIQAAYDEFKKLDEAIMPYGFKVVEKI